MNKQPETVAAAELQQFAAQYNAAADEKAKAAERMSEIMGEAKGRGYDAKLLKKAIAILKRKPDDVQEEEAILAIYLEALKQ